MSTSNGIRRTALPRWLVVCLGCALLLLSSLPSHAVLVSEIDVEFVPLVPAPGEVFQVILRGTASCLRLDEIRTEDQDVILVLDCNCFFVAPTPRPFEESIDLPPLESGSYNLILLDDSIGTEVPISTTPFAVGYAPAVPISPSALTLLALILVAAAVRLLRR